MHFIDKSTVTVIAGDGGDGRLSFRREKFVDKGGPDGGDGGNGGSVVFVASRNQNTLAAFRYEKELRAQPGDAGSSRNKHGRGADDMRVPVPVGTVVYDDAGQLLADLAIDGQEAVIAKGGQGGFGNAHFVSSTRQAPRIAEKGEKGERKSLQLELKMIADVGLVGLPNAGKSTLLSVISNARPEIADYPFTTLVPNLGVVDVEGAQGLLFADIPGLIEGAAEGKGLGDEFLRHVERTAVLVHLVDAYQEDVAETYKTIQKELKEYKVDLSSKPQIVALTKIEALDKEIVDDQLAKLRKALPKGAKLLAISALTKQGVRELLFAVNKMVQTIRAKQQAEVEEMAEAPVITLGDTDDAWRVAKEENIFVVRGAKIERFARRTDFDNPAGVERLRDIMRRMGIMHEVVRQKINPGDTIQIADLGEFVY